MRRVTQKRVGENRTTRRGRVPSTRPHRKMTANYAVLRSQWQPCCRFGNRSSSLGPQETSHRRPQDTVEERGPLKLASADAAGVFVLLVFCSTPEALNHIQHAPSKGDDALNRGSGYHQQKRCTNRANSPDSIAGGEKSHRFLYYVAACLPATYTRQALGSNSYQFADSNGSASAQQLSCGSRAQVKRCLGRERRATRTRSGASP